VSSQFKLLYCNGREMAYDLRVKILEIIDSFEQPDTSGDSAIMASKNETNVYADPYCGGGVTCTNDLSR
jgi:hypothetical protein